MDSEPHDVSHPGIPMCRNGNGAHRAAPEDVAPLHRVRLVLDLALSLQGDPQDPLRKKWLREAVAAAIVELETLPKDLQPLEMELESARWGCSTAHLLAVGDSEYKTRWRADP